MSEFLVTPDILFQFVHTINLLNYVLYNILYDTCI